MTQDEIKINLKEMFLLLLNSVDTLRLEEQEQVMNNMAYKLEEWYDVSRDDLRKLLQDVGFKLNEICISCNEEMPEFEGDGNPLCSICEITVASS